MSGSPYYNPAKLYEEGDETVRAILNKAFFSRFMIDGMKIVNGELKEAPRRPGGCR